jgi:hypothetical protein
MAASCGDEHDGMKKGERDDPKRTAERIRQQVVRYTPSVEAYILEFVVWNLDPNERARAYITSASALVEEAKVELRMGNLMQASNKTWEACVLAIKAHAVARGGLMLESLDDLWLHKDEVANELGVWVTKAFLMADSVYKNYYEATRMDVTVALCEVERLVKTIREVVK